MYVEMNGSELARKIKSDIWHEVERLPKDGRVPRLVILQVEGDPASDVYVRNKVAACRYCGFDWIHDKMSKDVTEDEIITRIETFNKSEFVDGIIVQLPLPDGIDEQKVLNTIDWSKDVDGLNDKYNGFTPCTALGIMTLFEEYDIDLDGKTATIIGRSNLVGKPLSSLLTRASATVTVCHSHTGDEKLKEYTSNSDIVVVAVGKPDFLTADMIKPGAVVIDVGTTKVNGRLKGDCADDVKEKAGYLTPVPGGVGPMTVASLMWNVWWSFETRRDHIWE